VDIRVVDLEMDIREEGLGVDNLGVDNLEVDNHKEMDNPLEQVENPGQIPETFHQENLEEEDNLEIQMETFFEIL